MIKEWIIDVKDEADCKWLISGIGEQITDIEGAQLRNGIMALEALIKVYKKGEYPIRLKALPAQVDVENSIISISETPPKSRKSNINDFRRTVYKIGQPAFYSRNGGMAGVIKRINPASVTFEDGNQLSFSRLLPSIDGRAMTVHEYSSAYAEWMKQNDQS